MTKKMLSTAALGCLLAVTALSQAGAEKRQQKLEQRAFMRQKLVYSQGILEGMALEKYELVSKNALHMRNMSKSNFWLSIKEVDYMRATTNFQKSIEALALAAADKQLDAVTEAYGQVAKNCVECHRIVRRDQRPGVK